MSRVLHALRSVMRTQLAQQPPGQRSSHLTSRQPSWARLREKLLLRRQQSLRGLRPIGNHRSATQCFPPRGRDNSGHGGQRNRNGRSRHVDRRLAQSHLQDESNSEVSPAAARNGYGSEGSTEAICSSPSTLGNIQKGTPVFSKKWSTKPI